MIPNEPPFALMTFDIFENVKTAANATMRRCDDDAHPCLLRFLWPFSLTCLGIQCLLGSSLGFLSHAYSTEIKESAPSASRALCLQRRFTESRWYLSWRTEKLRLTCKAHGHVQSALSFLAKHLTWIQTILSPYHPASAVAFV